MKWALLWFGFLCVQTGFAQLPVTVRIDARNPGHSIPADFSGLSFETGSEMPNKNRVSGYLFCATNKPLITLFRNAGIHNLRVGGGTVDGLKAAIPSQEAIDDVFAFAKAVGNLDVTYSLRLLNGDPTNAAMTARYIWRHYRPLLAAFAIGNEPDWKSFHFPPSGRGTDPAISDYPSYLADWRKFASAITNAAPGAKFVGPDTGDYTTSTYWREKSWTQLFADDERNSGIIAAVTQHYYVGGHPEGVSSAQAVHNMLSADWVEANYPLLYEHNLAAVIADGLPYRLTESNDYLTGIENASDTFAAALWALDYMHWWAAHGCAGVNFHNKSWLLTDTVYLDASGNYRVHPKAYGIKAFELGSRGRVEPLAMSNVENLNLTAYAVGDANQLFVTIINKEHGARASNSTVNIEISGFDATKAEAMFLISAGDDVAAKQGITLGGETIVNDAPWNGHWEMLNASNNNQCTVTMPPASAAVIKIEP
jgi:hypothetical protein